MGAWTGRALLLAAAMGWLGSAPPLAAQPASPPAEAPAPGAEPPAAPAPLPAERITFQLPVPEDQGGGTVSGSAGTIEFLRETYAVLGGGVELRYQDVVLRAERVEADLATRVVRAEGDVVIDQGPQRIAGATATYDLGAKTGTFTEASAYVDPDFYFGGAELAKVGPELFTVTEGTFTACSDAVPDWSFRLKSARVELEGYAHVRGAAMRVKKVPVLYLPYVLWPAKTERASGLLIPQPGYSNKRGFTLSLGYFQTLGRSYDTTLYADLSAEDYLGLGNEFRWAPVPGTAGEFSGLAIRDPEAAANETDQLSEWRWRASLDHVSERLPFGMRGVLALRDYSDFGFFRDFERDVDRSSIRTIQSRGFASGNWGAHSLNVLVDDRETLIVEDNPATPADEQRTITHQRLPEFDYTLRSRRLGRSPLYLDVEGSASFLSLDRTGEYEGSYGRFDLFPNLKLPLRLAPWLSTSIAGGYRYTFWDDSLCPSGGGGPEGCDPAVPAFSGESLSRALPAAGAEIVGPSLSRIFEGKWGKLKHIIEPRITYTFLGDPDEEDLGRAPLFDEVDSLSAANVGRFELVNRLLAKPADGQGSAREVLQLRVGQSYSFDDLFPLQVSGERTEPWGPLSALLRYEPGGGTSLQAQALYNTLTNQLTQRSLSGTVGFGRGTLGLTWFTRFNAETGEEIDDQARVSATLELVPDKLEVQGQVSYDFAAERGEPALLQQRYFVGYTSQCYAFRLEAREFRHFEAGRFVTDRDYRFLLTLKNVGTFLDLSGRQSTGDEY